MTQSNVSLVLRADIQSFTSSIHQAENEFSSRLKKMAGTSKKNANFIETDFKRLGEGVNNFVKQLKSASKHLLILGGAATGIGFLGKRMFEAADATIQMAAKLDVTTNSLQELRFAASQFGISSEKLESSLSVFSKKIGAAASGNEVAIKTYEALGISVLEADGSLRSVDAVLGDVADVMQGMDSQVERAALSTKLFGKEGAALSVLLSKGSNEIDSFRDQAHLLGIVIDEELLKSAEQASTQLSVLGKIIKANLTTAFAEFAPVVIRFTQGLINSLPTIKAFAAGLFEFKKAFIFGAEVLVGLKLTAFAKSIHMIAKSFSIAENSAMKFHNMTGLLTKALTGLGVGLAIHATVEGLMVLKQHLDLKTEIAQYIQSQQKIFDANLYYSNAHRISVAEFQNLSHDEQDAYRDRIKAAQQFWQSRLNLESRKDSMSEMALHSAKEHRLYFENLQAVEAVLTKRSALEKSHLSVVNTIRSEELNILKINLSNQLSLYDDANQKLAQLHNKRKDIAKEFQGLIAEINAPQKKATENLSVLDIISAQEKAKEALKSGDIAQAFQAVDEAKNVICSLMQMEGVTKSYLEQQASATAEIADEIVQQEITLQEAQLSTIQQKINEIKAEAELLKSITIDFDENGAVQSAELIRETIQKQLLDKPLTLPMVVIPQTENIDARVDTILKPQKKARGGMIFGPGTSMSDSILAQLSRGEFVIRASAVKHYGASLLNQLNQKQLPKFATGGLVPPSVPLIERKTNATNQQVANLTLNLGQERFTVSTPSVDVVQALTKAISREALKSGRKT